MPDDGLLWRELWSSFASLLRSYCAAHGLGREHQAILEVSAERITVRVGMKTMDVTQHAGKGSVRHVDGRTEAFEMLEDGHVIVGSVTEAMDMAAEGLAREILS
jgi:hypothetical protein